jgi:hypothetical protein
VSEQELMQSIKTAWGAAIADACSTSSIPENFLAALIAGESGGHNDARRFEKNVLLSLWEVLLGRKAAFGSIGRADLVKFTAAQSTLSLGLAGARGIDSLPPDAFQRVDGLATSWGLTQIMGYHVLGAGLTLDDLRDPAKHLRFALTMLTGFAHQFQLDVTREFDELFRCWNTGRPDGTTFDPAYVNNGLARMAVWTSL